MSQQYPQQPQNGWGGPQQPGWAGPQQPQPGWGAPPPPPKKNPGKIVGFSCLGIVAVFVGLAAIGAAVGNDDSSNEGKNGTSSVTSAPPAGKDDEQAAEEADTPSEPAEQTTVKITAKKTAFTQGILADSSNYTSVTVTVTNNSDEPVKVNPLYFSITDTNGTKHTSQLAADKNQIDTVELAPGENISGAVTGEGRFTPKYVTYTDGLFGAPERVDVS